MKILVVTYHFPPLGGMSPLRLVHFVKALKEKGYDVDVLTISPFKNHPIYKIDEGNLRLIPEGIRVIRTYPGLFHHLSSLLNSVRSRRNGKGDKVSHTKEASPYASLLKIAKPLLKAFIIPDTKSDWFPFALNAGYRLIKSNRYDLILSHGYPFTSHLVAYFLKKLSGARWIGDYGDPWVFNPDSVGLPRWRKEVDEKIETRLIKEMDRMIVTTVETAKGYLEFYPFINEEKIKVIECGYDSNRFREIPPETSDKFRIVYTGIFCETRRPDSFFKALKGFEKKKDFEVVIAGNIPQSYIKFVKELGVESIVEFRGHIPHRDAVALQKGASVLLIFGWAGGYQIPAKFFEYLAAQRPILAIRYDEKDIAAKLLMELKRGLVADDDPGSIREAIGKFYSDWKDGKLNLTFNIEGVDRFSWKNLTEKLVRIIEDVVGN
jgi:glycosyltransferase involved in cell wall biosynthesis